MTFYALEDKETFEKKNKHIVADGNYYTEFSRNYKKGSEAADFLRRNGKFWADRGVKLSLVSGNRIIANVNVDKIVSEE